MCGGQDNMYTYQHGIKLFYNPFTQGLREAKKVQGRVCVWVCGYECILHGVNFKRFQIFAYGRNPALERTSIHCFQLSWEEIVCCPWPKKELGCYILYLYKRLVVTLASLQRPQLLLQNMHFLLVTHLVCALHELNLWWRDFRPWNCFI